MNLLQINRSKSLLRNLIENPSPKIFLSKLVCHVDWSWYSCRISGCSCFGTASWGSAVPPGWGQVSSDIERPLIKCINVWRVLWTRHWRNCLRKTRLSASVHRTPVIDAFPQKVSVVSLYSLFSSTWSSWSASLCSGTLYNRLATALQRPGVYRISRSKACSYRAHRVRWPVGVLKDNSQRKAWWSV